MKLAYLPARPGQTDHERREIHEKGMADFVWFVYFVVLPSCARLLTGRRSSGPGRSSFPPAPPVCRRALQGGTRPPPVSPSSPPACPRPAVVVPLPSLECACSTRVRTCATRVRTTSDGSGTVRFHVGTVRTRMRTVQTGARTTQTRKPRCIRACALVYTRVAAVRTTGAPRQIRAGRRLAGRQIRAKRNSPRSFSRLSPRRRDGTAPAARAAPMPSSCEARDAGIEQPTAGFAQELIENIAHRGAAAGKERQCASRASCPSCLVLLFREVKAVRSPVLRQLLEAASKHRMPALPGK